MTLLFHSVHITKKKKNKNKQNKNTLYVHTSYNINQMWKNMRLQ